MTRTPDYQDAAPILSATRHFYGHDTEPCVLTTFEHQDWYHGTGVRPADHPGRRLRVLEHHLPDTRCGQCQSANVLVLALQWCVAYHSGDAYYDYEVRCQDCGTFSVFSYAEN
jgi:hypothetical protein